MGCIFGKIIFEQKLSLTWYETRYQTLFQKMHNMKILSYICYVKVSLNFKTDDFQKVVFELRTAQYY